MLEWKRTVAGLILQQQELSQEKTPTPGFVPFTARLCRILRAHSVSRDPGAYPLLGPSVILCTTTTINSLSLGNCLLNNTWSWLSFLQKKAVP